MKKAVFITYNQALTERVAFLLDQLQIKGFTQWPLVNGAGKGRRDRHRYQEPGRKDHLCHRQGRHPRVCPDLSAGRQRH